MTKQEAKEILDCINNSENLPDYEDIIEWLADACKTILRIID